MAQYLDENLWWNALAKPDWYVVLSADFARLEALAKQQEAGSDYKRIKREAYELVERSVQLGRMPLASEGENFDRERKLIDTAVIHHTKNPAGMTLERLNAIQLLRIYGRYLTDSADAKEQRLKGQPVWSGHFYNDQQVFWGYHWLVRSDGSSEHILKDEYIGWHAGNWEVNTRSVGICIDDDLSNKEPNQAVLKSVAAIIKQYPGVSLQHTVGHSDVNIHTVCPGHLFHTSWRQKLCSLAS
jgi:hypothetical protein